VVKEIRFGPQTDEHDYEFKRKNEKFLKEGAKLKAFVFFVVQLSIKIKVKSCC
jgi:translation initiation factor IF-3